MQAEMRRGKLNYFCSNITKVGKQILHDIKTYKLHKARIKKEKEEITTQQMWNKITEQLINTEESLSVNLTIRMRNTARNGSSQ